MVPELDLREIVIVNVRILQWFGVIMPEFKTTSTMFWAFVRTGIFVGFIFVTMLLSEVIHMIIVLDDVEQLTDASFLALSHIVEAVKYYYVYKSTTRLRSLINTINRKEFQPKNIDQYNILRAYVNDSKFITKYFLFLGMLVCVFLTIYPLTDVENEPHLPLAGWFPFDTSYSPTFEITYVYQTVANVVNAVTNIALDTFISGLIMFARAQLGILNDSIKNIREHAEMELDVKGETVGDVISPKLQEKMDEKLVECVVHHQCIEDFIDEVTALFTVNILGQLVVSVVIICITLFGITLLPVRSAQFLSLLLYQICLLLEIFLPCYYGNEVILQSEELTQSAYLTDWMHCSEEFKRNILFLMTRSQRELKFYAGRFFTLSLETFVKILRTSWSYYAVLNRVHSNEDL